jgi:hypothetical protein
MAYEPQVPATGTPPSEVEPDSETADVERDLEDLAPTKRAPRRSRNQASSTASPMTTSNEQGGSEPSPEAGMTSETSSMTLSSSMAVLRVDLNRFEGSLRGPETTN